MDLATGAKRVVVAMQQAAKGKSKIAPPAHVGHDKVDGSG